MVFQVVLDRVLSRLKGWKESSLTKVGREVLIKAVLQVIPTNILSCLLLPRSLCEDLEKAATSFFWGARGEHRKIH